jgi:hypothetical protein
MGLVFAARHLQLDEQVAIKILVREIGEHPEALARLRREARILARVRNEHVVQVFDLAQLDDGTPYMVMEYLDGRDLGSLLQDEGRFAVERAVELVLQALIALAVAHANGIVHRDLKPENLFCIERPDGTSLIKVIDFGISRLDKLEEGSAAIPMTHSGAMIGTPLYMSPEQLRNPRDVDARSDIWSVGIVLYELLTGSLPFSGVAIGDVAVKIAIEPPHAPRDVGAALPAQLEAVLLRCLEKDREKRFANVADLALALMPFAPRSSVGLVERVAAGLVGGHSVTPGGAAAPPSAGSGQLEPAGRAPDARGLLTRSRPRWFLLAALSLLALVVGTLSWRITSRTLAAPTPQPVTTSTGATVAGATPPSAAVSSAAPNLAALTEVSGSFNELPSKADVTAPSSAEPPPRAKVRPATSPGAGGSPNPACTPPYTIDLQGRKKFKHECFKTAPQ